jgi:hypothetical protein
VLLRTTENREDATMDAGADKATAGGEDAPSEMDPPGGHSRAALEDAEEKMHVSPTSDDDELHPDPPGGHDPAALEDAAKKMGAER